MSAARSSGAAARNSANASGSASTTRASGLAAAPTSTSRPANGTAWASSSSSASRAAATAAAAAAASPFTAPQPHVGLQRVGSGASSSSKAGGGAKQQLHQQQHLQQAPSAITPIDKSRSYPLLQLQSHDRESRASAATPTTATPTSNSFATFLDGLRQAHWKEVEDVRAECAVEVSRLESERVRLQLRVTGLENRIRTMRQEKNRQPSPQNVGQLSQAQGGNSGDANRLLVERLMTNNEKLLKKLAEVNRQREVEASSFRSSLKELQDDNDALRIECAKGTQKVTALTRQLENARKRISGIFSDVEIVGMDNDFGENQSGFDEGDSPTTPKRRRISNEFSSAAQQIKIEDDGYVRKVLQPSNFDSTTPPRRPPKSAKLETDGTDEYHSGPSILSSPSSISLLGPGTPRIFTPRAAPGSVARPTPRPEPAAAAVAAGHDSPDRLPPPEQQRYGPAAAAAAPKVSRQGSQREKAEVRSVASDPVGAARPGTPGAGGGSESSGGGSRDGFAPASGVGLVPPRSAPPHRDLRQHKYEEVVRQKDKRRQLHGKSCPCCADFYAAAGDVPPILELGQKADGQTHVNQVSRHRERWARPKTPPGYWNVGFPDSVEN